MASGVESLNVTSALSLILYELKKKINSNEIKTVKGQHLSPHMHTEKVAA